jgi:hypothetical protein
MAAPASGGQGAKAGEAQKVYEAPKSAREITIIELRPCGSFSRRPVSLLFRFAERPKLISAGNAVATQSEYPHAQGDPVRWQSG